MEIILFGGYLAKLRKMLDKKEDFMQVSSVKYAYSRILI